MLYLSLNVALQNETIDDIRSNLFNSLTKLVYRLSKTQQKVLFEHSLSWLEDKNKKLQEVGFEVNII